MTYNPYATGSPNQRELTPEEYRQLNREIKEKRMANSCTCKAEHWQPHKTDCPAYKPPVAPTSSVSTLRLLAKCGSMDLTALGPIADEMERLQGEAEVADEQLAQLRGFAEAHKTCVGLDELNALRAEIAQLRGKLNFANREPPHCPSCNCGADEPSEPFPSAWYRGVSSHVPGELSEYDTDFSWGDDQPSGEGWQPLYSKPWRHRESTAEQLRALLTRALNFIVSNYAEGDLPAFDKPDALVAEVHAALRGADAPPSKSDEHPQCSVANMWQCGSCRTFNPLLDQRCQKCGTVYVADWRAQKSSEPEPVKEVPKPGVRCKATYRGKLCCRPEGHDGEHIATGASANMRW